MQRFKKKQIFGQRSTITLLVFIIESINPVVHLKILEYLWSKYNKKTEIVIGKHFFIFFFFFFFFNSVLFVWLPDFKRQKEKV